MLINENTNQTTGTIMKTSPENRPTVTSEDENSCSDQQEHMAKRAIQFEKTTKEKADNILLRQATASIADALLRLGGSEDGSDTSSCDNMIKSRKRSVSLAAEADSYSTNSQSTDNDTDSPSNHKHTNKRQRTTPPPSHVVCSTPTKLCLPESSKVAPHGLRTRMNLNSWKEDSTLSFSTNEFQIKPSEKVPGDLGCISQLFHRDFRPLSAAPRMPRDIVPEDPPMKPMRSPYAHHQLSQGTMYSTAITEHNDCLIMHSYTVLPRMVPSHMALAQLANGM